MAANLRREQKFVRRGCADIGEFMRRILLASLIVLVVIVIPALAGMQEPIKVEGGLVSGISGWGWNVREYLGIPFAAPPVGNLRWRPPQPVVPWQGVRIAGRYGPACMQIQSPQNAGAWNRGLANYQRRLPLP